MTKGVTIKKLEADLWESADLLRAGSKLASNQYCMLVLRLILFALRIQPVQAGGKRDFEKPPHAWGACSAGGGQRFRRKERAISAERDPVQLSGGVSRQYRRAGAQKPRGKRDEQPGRGSQQRHGADRGPE